MSDEYELELPDGSTTPGIELYEDGEPVGWHLPELGLNVSADGVPFSHETGEQMEWVSEPDDYEQLQSQYDALEQRVDAPQEIIHTHQYQAAEPLQADVHDAWHRERAILESPGVLGRPLTNAEVVELATAAASDGHFSLVQAATDRADRGAPLRDIDSSHPGRAHAARVELAGELLAERSGQAGDPVTGERPRISEEYDSSSHNGRMQMFEDALAGHDIANRDISSATYPQAEEDWQYGDLD